MVADYPRFGDTYRLRVHSSLLLSVRTPEDIDLQTIECQRHKVWNKTRFLLQRGTYLTIVSHQTLFIVRPGRSRGQAGHA